MSRNNGVQRTGSDHSLDLALALRNEQEEPIAATAAAAATSTATTNASSVTATTAVQHQLQSSFIRRGNSSRCTNNSGISFANAVTILNADNSIDEIPFVMSPSSNGNDNDDAGGYSNNDGGNNNDSSPSVQIR